MFCFMMQSKTLTKSQWPFEVQLGRIYTRPVFNNFEKKMFKCTAYNIVADPELGEHWYRVSHRNESERISWGQHKFIVKADKENGSYSCECREWEHTGSVECLLALSCKYVAVHFLRTKYCYRCRTILRAPFACLHTSAS
jgi:hypothetical protein